MYSKSHKKVDKKYYSLIIFIIWLLFTLVAFLIALPTIKQSIINSDIISLIEQPREIEKKSITKELTIFYAQSIEGKITAQPVFLKVKRYGGTSYQDAIEALIAGPEASLKLDGFINLFPKGTELIGSTLSSGVYFIDFNSKYLACIYPDLCLDLITQTLQLINSDIKEVRITIK